MKGSSSRKPGPVSLARVLSKMGLTSRSQARILIESGRVQVNGRIVRDGSLRVFPGTDRISVDGKKATPAERCYFALNKPRGLVTTTQDEQGRATVYECLRGLPVPWLAPVGRLDKASEGLILFTNDPRWGQKILDAEERLPKIYHVRIDRHLAESALDRLRDGVILEDGIRARAAAVRVLRSGKVNCWIEVTLVTGLNRQIRRMVAAVGASVLRLVRVAIGPVKLGGLPKSKTRPLTKEELEGIEKATGSSCTPDKISSLSPPPSRRSSSEGRRPESRS